MQQQSVYWSYFYIYSNDLTSTVFIETVSQASDESCSWPACGSAVIYHIHQFHMFTFLYNSMQLSNKHYI